MSLLPSRSDSSPSDDAGPRVVDVDSEDAEAVIAALSSETARKLLNELHESPAPPGDLAERADTSVQNAKYHLDKLQDAGAIEVVDTAYSAKGREMDVYAPADQPLVIYAGDTDTRATLRSALSRLLGALGILAMASFVVQAVADQSVFPWGSDDVAPAADDTADEPDDTDDRETEDTDAEDDPETEEPVADDGGDVSIASEPAEEEPEDDAPPEEEEVVEDDEVPEDDGDDSIFDTADANLTDDEVVNASNGATNGADDAHVIVEFLGSLPPGALFFAGGLLVLCLVAGFQYYRARRGIPGPVAG